MEGVRIAWDRAAEQLPLNVLVEMGERKLLEGRVVERAFVSSMYRRPWKEAGVDPRAVQRRSDLRQLPFSSAADHSEAQRRRPLPELPCALASIWFAGGTPGEGRRWVPYGKGDVLQYMGLLARLGGVTEVAPKELFLAVPPMAPRVTNALPYLWIYTDMLETKLGLEFVVGSLYMLGRNNWPEFALRKQPTALLCRPGEALSLVDNFASAANRPGARPSELFRRLRRGIFFGEPLAPLRSQLEEAYGLEAFDCYLSAEFAGLFAECRAHDGLHLWLDVCIAEVIPDQGPDLEHSGVRAVPGAAFLDQAAPGLVGELVLTTFGESLPLVRYRTGDRIEVVSTAPCACGRTHPRVRFLGRVTS